MEWAGQEAGQEADTRRQWRGGRSSPPGWPALSPRTSAESSTLPGTGPECKELTRGSPELVQHFPL
jgi:hypothetical protein